tara:strand:+ start:936 stop:1376 length:441 start_codon:yes stop_codon:yes gene_type:complete
MATTKKYNMPSEETEKKWLVKWCNNWSRLVNVGNISFSVPDRYADDVWKKLVKAMFDDEFRDLNYSKCTTAYVDPAYKKQDKKMFMLGVNDTIFNEEKFYALCDRLSDYLETDSFDFFYYKNNRTKQKQKYYEFKASNEYEDTTSC